MWEPIDTIDASPCGFVYSVSVKYNIRLYNVNRQCHEIFTLQGPLSKDIHCYGFTLHDLGVLSCKSYTYYKQGWEFAHRFSERIARFLRKNERMSDSLKKTSNSLISSFLVSDLSKSLMVAHIWWATWANCSFLVSDLSDSLTSLIFGEQPKRFAHIAYQNWGNERIAHFLK